ncbi:MAG: HAD family hydrolase [Gammaproteobacteria bacterium]|jgi:hypothetical protein
MTRLHIAMWSGPRNISTAMMRAFENRPDTEVWDEPMYGHYLYKTGIPHPGADEVIADQGINWQDIARRCLGNAPNNAPVFYQKHMTMHLLPEMSQDWVRGLTNCFLIRKPDQVVASYGAVRPDLTLDDLGFIQQAKLFDYVIKTTSTMPMVIDSKDFLLNPETMLRKMCERFDIPFRTEMIAWPEGKRDTDGVWGKHWYDSVWKSTGFAEYEERPLNLSPELQKIADEAEPYYQVLYQHRLTV